MFILPLKAGRVDGLLRTSVLCIETAKSHSDIIVRKVWKGGRYGKREPANRLNETSKLTVKEVPLELQNSGDRLLGEASLDISVNCWCNLWGKKKKKKRERRTRCWIWSRVSAMKLGRLHNSSSFSRIPVPTVDSRCAINYKNHKTKAIIPMICVWLCKSSPEYLGKHENLRYVPLLKGNLPGWSFTFPFQYMFWIQVFSSTPLRWCL